MHEIHRMNIVITGASRGLGKAIARAFAKEGNTLLLGSQSKENLEKMVEELQKESTGCRLLHKNFDASSKEDVIAFGAWVMEVAGSVDILVNNVGSYMPGSLHNEPDGTLEKMIEVNLYSAYHLTRVLVTGMIENKKGHVFNMCSIASLNAYANGGAYSISKFALYGFSKNLREELKEHGIKVTHIIPGATYTDSWASSGIDPQRLMEADDVAKMVVAASQLSHRACPEEIVLRPILGDL